MVPYVLGAVVALTVVCMMLFVLDVNILRECEGDDNSGVGDGRGLVAMNAWHEYIGGTRGSRIMSSKYNVFVMSVRRGVCEMCMCLAWGGQGGEGVS